MDIKNKTYLGGEKMKRRKWFMPVALGTMLVLSACSGGGDGAAEKDKDKDKAVTPTSDDKNEIVVGVVGDPQSWDPIDSFKLDWSTVATSVFEGLTERDLDLELKPGLAEEWTYLDDKTIEFKLREGVKFHNDEPFNAEAVKFTFDRLLGEEGQSGPQYSNYTSIDPVLLTKLSGYGAVIVPPKYVQENSDEFFNSNPVGTGPFKMVSYKRDQQVELEKNDNYWKEGLPKLDKITFKVIPEASTRLAELQTGGIDIMKRVEVSQAETVKENESLELQEVAAPTAHALRFDTARKPFDQKEVRQAVNYAIDTQAIIDEILGGYGEPISTFQSTISFGDNPDLKPYEYDPEKAKKMLKEAGVEEGTVLEVYIPGNNSTFKEITQAVAFYLEEVGMKMNINSVDSTTLTGDLIPTGKAGEMYYNGWGGWTLDFDNTAYLMYFEGEYWNPTFKNEKVEELLLAERTSVDQEDREKIFMELTELLYDLAPEVNLYSSLDLYGVNDRIENFQSPHEDRMRFEEVSVK